MSDIQDKRFIIYPQNSKKAEELMRALNLPNISQLVNYLIESVDVEQITKITVTDAKTKKSFVKLKSSRDYNPKNW